VPRAKRLRLLESLAERARVSPRLALRAGSALKAAHFGSAGVRSLSGCAGARAIDEPAPRWSSQIVDLDKAAADEELEADVAIVGSGAGGAAAARQLTSRGLAVVVPRRAASTGAPTSSARSSPAPRRCTPPRDAVDVATAASCCPPAGRWRHHRHQLRDLPARPAVGAAGLEAGPRRALDEQELEPWFKLVEPGSTCSRPAAALGEPRASSPAAPPRWASPTGRCRATRRTATGTDLLLRLPHRAKRSAEISLLPAALKAGAMLYAHATVDDIVAGGTGSGARLVARAPSGPGSR
jgi:hypothetical protein